MLRHPVIHDAWTRLAFTLLIGAAGGAVFAWLRLPLAWMIGAMIATTAASLGGRRLLVPPQLRAGMIVVLGVLLGSTFTPDIVEQAGRWPITLGFLVVYLALLTGTLYLYFSRIVKLDRMTAFFSATPGGMTEMVVAGAAMGGDDRTIALVHSSRVLLVVLIIPFWFRFSTGVVASPSDVGPSLEALALPDAAVLAACGVAGALLGRLLRLPAYLLVGPMLASAAIHALGVSDSAPPYAVVAVAQVVLGCAIGARFSGVPAARVLRLFGAGVGSTALMLATTVVFALSLSRASGIDWQPIVLAYSPGGLTEMSLVSLALGIETAFVSTHHVCRIALIVLGAPLLFRLIGRRRG